MGVFGVIWGQNPNIFKPRQIIYQNEVLGPVIKKKMVFKVIRGHLTPKLGVFGFIWGQNPNIFNPRQIIHQNEAFGPVITKTRFSRSVEVTRPQIWGYLGSFRVKIQTFSNLDKLYTKMKLWVP